MVNALNSELEIYIQQLNEVEKKSVLLLIKTFIGSRNHNLELNELAAYNKEIDDALTEVESGHFYTQEEIEKEAASWLGK